MPSRPVIYVSTSEDFFRSSLRGTWGDGLRAICAFCAMDTLGQQKENAIRAFRATITTCDAVVHIVGERFGPGPHDAGEGGVRRSFAQMEYDLAAELAKPLYVVLYEGTPPGISNESESAPPEPEELASLQRSHRDAVASRPQGVTRVRGAAELKTYLLDLALRLTPATPSAQYLAASAPSSARFALAAAKPSAPPQPSNPPPAEFDDPTATTAAPVRPEPGPPRPSFPAENVVFTAYRPGNIRPGQWEKLLFFAHLDEKPAWMDEDERAPIEEMEAQAAAALGRKLDQYSRHSGDSRFPIPRDGEITLVPEMAGVEFDPPRRAFFWREGVAVHGETCRLRADAGLDGGIARGRITVFLGTLILAEIGLAFRVGGGAAQVGVGGISWYAQEQRHAIPQDFRLILTSGRGSRRNAGAPRSHARR